MFHYIAPHGYRSVLIAFGWFVLTAWQSWLADVHITDMAGVFGATGMGAAALVGAKAANEWVKAKGGNAP